MLCAFYAYEVSESAPESRSDLYEQLIETLVDRRDRVRSAIHRDRRRFTSNEKLALLQAVARHLTENELLTIPTRRSVVNRRIEVIRSEAPTALAIMAREARSLVTMSLSASDALDYLLQRSIVFREVAPNKAQFVHRSIQEFLTARSFATTGEVQRLLEHVGSARWNDIISFASARLDSRDATRLITTILDRAESSGYDTRELLLLAAECLSTARVEPDLVDRASQALNRILPPRSLREAELIGRSGEGVIRFLSKYTNESDEIVAACLHAAAITGSTAGMAVIASYLPFIRSSQLKSALLDAWQYFDAEEYAKVILARVPFGEYNVRFTNVETLSVAPIIRSLRKVEIDLHAGDIDFTTWGRLNSLRELDCSKFGGLSTLAGLSEIQGLKRLNLSGRTTLSNFEEIGTLVNLVELYLDRCTKLTNTNFLAKLTKLRVLSLNNCTGIRDFDWLAEHGGLLTLSLNGCRVDSLSFMAHLSKLRVLRMETADGFSDYSPLERCNDLKRLSLSLAARRGPLSLPDSLPLSSITLSGSVAVEDLHRIADFPGLTEVTAVGVQGLRDLVPLSEMRELKVLRLFNCSELSSCNGIEQLGNLKKLELIGCDIRYPHIPRTLDRLREVNFDQCPDLGSIEQVIWLPSLEKLTLPPMDSTVLSWMERQAANRGLALICDPIPGGYETG